MSLRIPLPARARTARLPAPLLVAALACLLTLRASATPSPNPDLRTCEHAMLQGQADQAIAGLNALLARNPADAAAHLLLCRAYLAELRGPEAASQCQLALQNGLAQNSAAQDWTGRALGLQAQHASPLAGLKLAGQVRSAFQAAYSLDPHSPAAANDLGEFYVDAPFLVGGGAAKVTALATQLQSTLPEIAHRLRALLAEKNNDPATAEREFLAATQVANAPGAWVDLANFYVRQHQNDKAVAAARRAIALDHAVDANAVDAAIALSDAHQTAQAEQTLRAYLDHGERSDQAPAFKVHTLLGETLAQSGNKTQARAEFQAALALAAGYAPARKGLASL